MQSPTTDYGRRNMTDSLSEAAIPLVLEFACFRTVSAVMATGRFGRRAARHEFCNRSDNLRGGTHPPVKESREYVIRHELAREKSMEFEWQDYLHWTQDCITCRRYPNLFRYYDDYDLSSFQFFVRIVRCDPELDGLEDSKVLFEGALPTIKINEASRRTKGCSPLLLDASLATLTEDLHLSTLIDKAETISDDIAEIWKDAQGAVDNLAITIVASDLNNLSRHLLVVSTTGYQNTYIPPHRQFVDILFDDRGNNPHDTPSWFIHCGLRIQRSPSPSCSIVLGWSPEVEEEEYIRNEELAEAYLNSYERSADRQRRVQIPRRRWRWSS